MNAALRFVILGLATAGFLAYIPYKIVPFVKWKGSGLIGSLAGLGLLLVFPEDPAFLLIASIILVVLSIWIAHHAEKLLGSHDDPRIVIDEVVGMWLAAVFLPRTQIVMVTSFILFRVLDVWKGPWGQWAQRRPGGWGIVLDDLFAGVIANVIVRLGLLAIR